MFYSSVKRALKIVQTEYHCNTGQFSNALPQLLTLLAGQLWPWLVKNLILLWQCSFFPLKVYSKLREKYNQRSFTRSP